MYDLAIIWSIFLLTDLLVKLESKHYPNASHVTESITGHWFKSQMEHGKGDSYKGTNHLPNENVALKFLSGPEIIWTL